MPIPSWHTYGFLYSRLDRHFVPPFSHIEANPGTIGSLVRQHYVLAMAQFDLLLNSRDTGLFKYLSVAPTSRLGTMSFPFFLGVFLARGAIQQPNVIASCFSFWDDLCVFPLHYSFLWLPQRHYDGNVKLTVCSGSRCDMIFLQIV